jgi:hypothetical protein
MGGYSDDRKVKQWLQTNKSQGNKFYYVNKSIPQKDASLEKNT